MSSSKTLHQVNIIIPPRNTHTNLVTHPAESGGGGGGWGGGDYVHLEILEKFSTTKACFRRRLFRFC